MLFSDIVGMRFERDGIRFNPYIPQNINKLEIGGLSVRNCKINISIIGSGKNINKFTVNGEQTDSFISYNGDKNVKIEMQYQEE